VPLSILLITGRIPSFSVSSRFTKPFKNNLPMNNCLTTQQALVSANRELITRFERKIQATLARIWGDNEAVSADAAEQATSAIQTEVES